MNFEQAVKAGSLYHLGMIAADDFEKIIADDRYNPHYNEGNYAKYPDTRPSWNYGPKNKGKTYDNLAGSVLVKTFGYGEKNGNYNHILKSIIRCQCNIDPIEAINCLARNFIWRGYEKLGRNDIAEKLSKRATPIINNQFINRKDAKLFLEQLRRYLPKLKVFEESVGILPKPIW